MTAPTLVAPPDQVVEATGSDGAIVTYPAATATDAVTVAPTITYSQASGTKFPLGVTEVTVTATDEAKNVRTATFNIMVRDTMPPQITPPSAQLTPSKNAVKLSVSAIDAGGENALTYTWSVVSVSPSPVSFTENGNNAAKNTIATVSKPGDYSFAVIVTNAMQRSTHGAVAIHIDSQLASIIVSPAAAIVSINHSRQFSANSYDQFGNLFTIVASRMIIIPPPPPPPSTPFIWTVDGGGTINQDGLFTADKDIGGPYTVSASFGDVTGTATVSVALRAPPCINQQAYGFVGYDKKTIFLDVDASDDDDQILTYKWELIAGPNTISYAHNNDIYSSTQAYLSEPGIYVFKVTVTNNFGLASVSITDPIQTARILCITISPQFARVSVDNTQQFIAIITDQWNVPYNNPPQVDWNINGGGTIDATGLFTPTVRTGGRFEVRASVEDSNAWATLELVPAITIRIVSPDDGSVYDAPGDITITAEAESIDSKIVKVEFFDVYMSPYHPIGQAAEEIKRKLGEATEPPYTLHGSSIPPGTYTIRAIATDDSNVTGSDQITVRVVYQIYELLPLSNQRPNDPGSSVAHGINDNDEVVGCSTKRQSPDPDTTLVDKFKAVQWHADQPDNPEILEGLKPLYQTDAHFINNVGQVAGFSSEYDPRYYSFEFMDIAHPVLWPGPAPMGNRYIEITALSNNGTAVGCRYDKIFPGLPFEHRGHPHAVLITGAGFVALESPGNFSTTIGIDDQGMIFGCHGVWADTFEEIGFARACAWDNGAIIDLHQGDVDADTYVATIDHTGKLLIGYSSPSVFGYYWAERDALQTWHFSDVIPWGYLAPMAMNDQGDVLAEVYWGICYLIRKNGKAIPLGDLIRDTTAWYNLRRRDSTCVDFYDRAFPIGPAFGINNKGSIIGTISKDFGNDQHYRGYLLKCDSIFDNDPPQIVQPDDIKVWAELGETSVKVNYPDVNVTGATIITYDHPNGDEFPIGKTIVTVTAADEAWNTACVTFTVTVMPIDVEPNTVVAGNTVSLRIWSIYRDDEHLVEPFHPSNDYVRFFLNGVDVTGDPNETDPDILATQITLQKNDDGSLQQTLTCQSETIQYLDMKVFVGAALAPDVYDVKLKLGIAQDDPNDYHCAKKALSVLKIEVTGGYYVDSLAKIIPVQVKGTDGKSIWLGYGTRIDNDHPAAAIIKVTTDQQTITDLIAGKLSLFDTATGEKCISLKDSIKTNEDFLKLFSVLHAIWAATPEWLRNLLGWQEPTVDNTYSLLLTVTGTSQADIDKSWQTPAYTAPAIKEFVLGKAKGDNGPKIKVRLEIANVVADTNRDGQVNDADITDEKNAPVAYLNPKGALTLANTNFDGQLTDKKRDCDDEQVNGADDLNDVAMLNVHKIGLAANEIPDDMTVKLELLNPDGDTTGLTAAQKAHVFDGHQNNSTVMMGGTKPVIVVYKKNPGAGDRNIDDLAGPDYLKLGVEGVEYGTEIIVKLTVSKGSQTLLVDNQHILVSPFLVTSSVGTLKTAFVASSTTDTNIATFANNFAGLLGDTQCFKVIADYYGNDLWVQDCMSIGYSRQADAGASGFREMNVVLDLSRPAGLGVLPAGLSGAPYSLNMGYVKVINAVLDVDEATHNGGGNIIASPPIANSPWPAGRIVTGSGIHPDLKSFFERQKVQVDQTSGLVTEDTSWLAVGHIDEIVAFCEINGSKKMLIAAPQDAMFQWSLEGGIYDTWAKMTVRNFLISVGKRSSEDIDKSVPAATQAMTMTAYNQSLWDDHLRVIRNTLPELVGLTIADVIKVPVVFMPDTVNGTGKAATIIFPNRVNLFVRDSGVFTVGDMLLPFDPVRDVVAYRLGNISTTWFIDSSSFYEFFGDVHCASNAVRSGPTVKEWVKQ
ncbi:MAG: protein-arginine deiminase family protein [Planctomycetota bacterium]